MSEKDKIDPRRGNAKSDARIYQGGTADNRRKPDGAEPEKPRTRIAHLELNADEQALNAALLFLGISNPMTKRRAISIAHRGADISLHASEGTVTYVPTNTFHGSSSFKEVFDALSRKPDGVTVDDKNNVTINVKALKEFVTSAPVIALLDKANAHEKHLPAATDGDIDGRMEKALAGLTGPRRADIRIELPKVLEEWQRALTIAARSGNNSHSQIAKHELGGRGTA